MRGEKHNFFDSVTCTVKYMSQQVNPTLSINGVEYIISDGDDASDLFTKISGIESQSTVGIWNVEGIDGEVCESIVGDLFLKVNVTLSESERNKTQTKYIPEELRDVTAWNHTSTELNNDDGTYQLEYQLSPARYEDRTINC